MISRLCGKNTGGPLMMNIQYILRPRLKDVEGSQGV